MWQACVQLALRQEGLITLDQALSLGCSASGFKHHVAKGHVERLLPGVYVLSGSTQTPRQKLRGTCLWGGEGTAASHSSAAALLGLKGFSVSDLHAVATKSPRRLPDWVHIHRVATAVPGTRPIAGIPVTPPWITLIDLGSQVPATQVERALDEALRRRILSLPQLRWALATFGRPHHRGTTVLHTLVAERGAGYAPPESEMEAMFYALLEGSHLPRGVRQFWVWDGEMWRRFDYAFPEDGLGLEFDGLATHGSREAFQDDRARDRRLQIRGWRILRFTWEDGTRRPQQVLAEIREMLPKRPHSRPFGNI